MFINTVWFIPYSFSMDWGFFIWIYREWFLLLVCREQLSPILKHTNMKSRISIEVDFENYNQPVIKILSNDSDDVRDKLLKSFLQGLGHQSRWCRIEYKGQIGGGNPLDYSNNSVYHISVIGTNDLKQESDLMRGLIPEQNGSETIGYSVMDNSKGFHNFLDKEGIGFTCTGHNTIVHDTKHGAFILGQKLQAYKEANSNG